MSDILADYFDAIADRTDDSDWQDVRRRAAGSRRPVRSLLAAAFVGAAVAAAPALAFSAGVQQLVGLRRPAPPSASTSWTRPRLVAKVTGMSFQKLSRYGLPRVTVTFTVGEAGKAPGTGITFGSYFLVDVASATGAPFLPVLARAYGAHGHYEVTTPVPPGGIGSIKIAGFINHPTGPSAANGTFWIPVVIPVQEH